MARMNSSQSKVAAARPESISMRTTIPTFLAKKMNLDIGDTLNWDLDKIDGEWVMTIRKAKNASM
ncbi:MAG: hypothetical protein OXC46_10210 [Thaumarchaeota archaeon]|nr:hypothetical protein [Nitrososphaerota archaeon]